jgi:hypothetical protein
VFRAEELFLGPLGPCDCFENVGEAFPRLPSRSDGHNDTASARARSATVGTEQLRSAVAMSTRYRALREVGYRAEAKRSHGLPARTLE